jgi:small subunit ribosomal protein S18
MCENKISFVDYKDFNFLRRFISDRGRIVSRRKSGACAKHQRALAQAIKRARHLALLPYTAEHIRVSGVGYYR